MNRFSLKPALAAMALAVAPAIAADDHKGHDHDEKKGAAHAHDSQARHGGVVSVVKDVNYELVATPDGLALYVSDHGKPVDLKGASARVTLLNAADKAEATLAPAGDRLEAKGSFKVAPGTKAVAQVTLPGQSPAVAKFTLRPPATRTQP
jgi:hypothetical protein